MLKRITPLLFVVLSLLVVACGGSDSARETISEDEAVAFATQAAVADGLSTDGLSITPTMIFGEWQVSFEPEGTTSLAGGFLVTLDDATGEVIEVIRYQ